MQKIDAALLALEAEIFTDDPVLAENDEFLVKVLSHWSPAERRQNLVALIGHYGKPDIGSHIVQALARLICRDIESEIDRIFGRVNHFRG
jgi:hypothetical protein